MIITQVHLVLGIIKGHSKMCSFVTQSTDVSCFEGACNCHADCRNVHQSCCQIIVNFSTISRLLRLFRLFGSTSNRPHNHKLYQADGRQRVWRCVGKRFADVNAVNRVPHGGGGVMVWAAISYRQRTQWQFECTEIP